VEIKATEPLTLSNQQIQDIEIGVNLVTEEIKTLRYALKRVKDITTSQNITFDSSPAAISKLMNSDGVDGALNGKPVNGNIISIAEKAASYFLAELPLTEIDDRQQHIYKKQSRLDSTLVKLDGYCQRVGLSFDGTQTDLIHISALSRIAASAPQEMLVHRRLAYLHPGFTEVVSQAEFDLASEREQRERLDNAFYLDTLPSIDELRTAIRAFRQGDAIFNFLGKDWRASTKLYQGISRIRGKRKARECEEQLTRLLRWLEQRESFIGNGQYKDAFGALFKGPETDFSKIRRLHRWYAESQGELLKHPALADKVDLTALDARHISQLSAWNSSISAEIQELDEIKDEILRLASAGGQQLANVLTQFGYKEFSQKALGVADNLKKIAAALKQYVDPSVSPKRAFELLVAKNALTGVSADLQALQNGITQINEKVGKFLPGVASIRCENWMDYLTELERVALAGAKLGATLVGHVPITATANEVFEFLGAKRELDSALEMFAPAISITAAQDWQPYSNEATSKISAARQLVAILAPAAITGKTPKEVVVGLGARKDAADIIHNLSNSSVVTTILAGLFAGVNTNLNALSVTLEWSQKVLKSCSDSDSVLRTALLSVDAIRNYQSAKSHLQQVAQHEQQLKWEIQNLDSFGKFDWQMWNNNNQTLAAEFYASSLLLRIQKAVSNVLSVLPLSKYYQEQQRCKNDGLGEFIKLLEQRRIPAASTGAVFEYTAYHSIARALYQVHPELHNFSGATHEQVRAEFSQLDKEVIELTGKIIAYEIDETKVVPEGRAGFHATDYTEKKLLLHEISEKKNIPIRQLVKRAGRAIQALKPCFMMGPMSVAQYLEQGAVSFDMVVMDEASQLRPEDALGAIARGKQIVIVGDPKQLPPTSFFDRMIDGSDQDGEDEGDAGTPASFEGSESILDICKTLFPERMLRWHYRSQHHSLIEFSNRNFYNSKLIVFPSPYDRNNRLGVRSRYIKNGVYKDRRNLPEAQRVVDAVVEHMISFPDESLGVVTLNQTQRDLIEDVLEIKIRDLEKAQTYLDHWEKEGWPFFIKNLENVQGDERDVIFISTTFGKAPGTDKPHQYFGPISRENGGRRLNVLFTRARRKIELFTSMRPEDIVLDVKTPAGTKALRGYLDFARQGIVSLPNITGRAPDSDFEVSVSDVLRAEGYDVVPQLGVEKYFIDIAVRNRDRPGEFLAAIECDGATYHSSRSARDRDRIRQNILESLGWKGRIWRIWSTDWFYNPQRETTRLLEFLDGRRRDAQKEPTFVYETLDYAGEDVKVVVREEDLEPLSDPELFISEEELYVEVGDRVTYCFIDKPSINKIITIVDPDNIPNSLIANEQKSLARSLLNRKQGEKLELINHEGNPPRPLKITKIQRQQLGVLV
jgi:very-short-patch-repair endonuclease